MAKRDLYNNIGIIAAVAPAVLTATTTSPTVDVRGFNAVTLIVLAGAVTGAGNVTPKLQESDDGANFLDVASVDLLGSFPTFLAANGSYKVGYKGYKRFLRSVNTLNSGTSVAVSVAFIGSSPDMAPVL